MTEKSAPPTKAPTSRKPPSKPQEPQPKSENDSEQPSEQTSVDHPAGQGIPYPSDPSAAQLQAEQDELQQPGRVKRAVADQIDNDPGYSKDQLNHMGEYWSHGDAVGDTTDE